MILLILYHLPQHKSKLNIPTKSKLKDQLVLDRIRCQMMLDVVFWQGEMYDCEVNQNVITKITDVMRWGVSIEQIKELNNIAGN